MKAPNFSGPKKTLQIGTRIMNDDNTDNTAEIQRRAYLIWERENRPEGKHLECWLCAEAELSPATGQPESGHSDPSNTGSGGSAAKARARRNA
jgi:hypothetical protein